MAEMNCALCANKVVFPVRFIGEDEREIGYDYHLIAACMVLSERLLASHGEDPQITELTRLPVIRLVQVDIKDREFGHFQSDEPCDEAIRDRGENVQAFALKLVHAFKESYDSGQMRSLGKRDWIRLRDEYLPRSVRKVFGSPNDVRDCEVRIVNDTGQMIQARAISSLNHVVLFSRPIERHIAANEIAKLALPVSRHLQTDDGFPSLGFECGCLLVRLSHPFATVDEVPLLFLRGLALRLRLFRLGVVAVC